MLNGVLIQNQYSILDREIQLTYHLLLSNLEAYLCFHRTELNNVCANAETGMYCYFAVIRLVNFFRSPQLYYSHCKSSTTRISRNLLNLEILCLQLSVICLGNTTRLTNSKHPHE